MLSPFRWIMAIVNAAKSVGHASFVRNDFSPWSNTMCLQSVGKVTAEKFDEVFKKARTLFVD